MKKYLDFSLVGCGTVQDLNWMEAEGKIRIEVMACLPRVGEQAPDHIILDCVILPQLKERIRHLDLNHPVAEGVQIEFGVTYRHFGHCHHGQRRSDPANLLTIYGELVSVSSWKRDGTASLSH